jgi:PAS domain S-box-containing protein
MNPSAKKNKGLKTEPEIKGQKIKSSLDKKSIENIPAINSNFFEKSLDAMMIGSQDGRIYVANTAACKMLGWSEKEICRLGRQGIVEQNPNLTEAVRKRRESGNFFGELTLIKKDGTAFPIELSSSVFKGSDGMEFTTLIIRDITERKKTEEALIKSEENYRFIYDNAREEIAKRKLAEKEFFHQNTILAKLNKFSIELSKLSAEDNLEAFLARQLKIISGARVTIFSEYNHSNRTTSIRHIEMEPLLLKKVISLLGKQVSKIVSKVSEEEYQVMVSEIIGVRNTLYEASFGSIPKKVAAAIQRLINVDRFIGIAYIIDGKLYGTSLLAMDKDRPDLPKDILENFAFLTSMSLRRKQAEVALKEREAEYRSLFENSIIGISQALPDGKIIRINKAYVDMYGYPDINTMMKEIATGILKLFSNPEDRKIVIKSLDESGYMPPTEFELNRQNGEKFWAMVGAKKVKDNSGMVMYLQAEHIDITSQKKMEEELLKSHELLEKLNQHLINAIEEERNQIALNLHDDLGQKLTAINLDIAWLKGRVGVQSKTVLEKFEEMSTMIKETIESIKETSSFLRPAILFDLGLVPAIKSQLDKFEKQTGIKCHFYFRPQDFLLEDRLALILYRILQESLTNIARHSGASKADVNLYVLKNKIEMVIKDDGTGIEKNKVNSFKSLGIAGIKERVKSVDGRITITGVHGSGTLIRVAIPLLKMKTND